MKTLQLSIIIGVGIIASFGIIVLLTPQTIGLHPNPQASLEKSVFAGIAVNSNTNRVYVADLAGRSVFVLDGHTNQTLDVIPINGNPWDVAVNSLTNKVYVVNRYSDNAVTIIDGSTDQIIDSINVADMGAHPPQMAYDAMRVQPTYYKIEPMQVAVNPNTNRIYVSDWNYPDGGVTVIDGTSDKVIDTILGLGGLSYGIAVNPNTNRIYVDNFQSSRNEPYNVSVIDGQTDKIMTNVTIGLGKGDGSSDPQGLRIIPLTLNPATNLIYAYYRVSVHSGSEFNDSDSIVIINGTSNKIVDTIPMYVSGMDVNLKTNMVFVAVAGGQDPRFSNPVFMSGSFDIAVIDGKTDKIVDYLKTDNVVSDVTVNSKTNSVYVTSNEPKNSVSIFDLENKK